jgi:hypothetical protein
MCTNFQLDGIKPSGTVVIQTRSPLIVSFCTITLLFGLFAHTVTKLVSETNRVIIAISEAKWELA